MSETKHHVFKCILYIEESATAKVNNFAMLNIITNLNFSKLLLQAFNEALSPCI